MSRSAGRAREGPHERELGGVPPSWSRARRGVRLVASSRAAPPRLGSVDVRALSHSGLPSSEARRVRVVHLLGPMVVRVLHLGCSTACAAGFRPSRPPRPLRRGARPWVCQARDRQASIGRVEHVVLEARRERRALPDPRARFLQRRRRPEAEVAYHVGDRGASARGETGTRACRASRVRRWSCLLAEELGDLGSAPL
jgi:hypothetical protein